MNKNSSMNPNILNNFNQKNNNFNNLQKIPTNINIEKIINNENLPEDIENNEYNESLGILLIYFLFKILFL